MIAPPFPKEAAGESESLMLIHAEELPVLRVNGNQVLGLSCFLYSLLPKC